jgi:hypothetical protein
MTLMKQMSTEKSSVIWSEEHGAWWAPDRHGYTRSLNMAGRYSREEATLICEQANKYCAAGIWNECCLPDPIKRDAEIERLKALLEHELKRRLEILEEALQRQDNVIIELKALLSQTAEAIDPHLYPELVAELRKATE